MASYLKPGVAADHAHMLAELRASNTLRGRAVESWCETVSDDGAQLLLRVTFAPLQPQRKAPGVWGPTNWGITETLTFSALQVAALEGERGKTA
jgi:hypothetical protein